MDKVKKINEIISDCLKFAFTDMTESELALLIQHVKIANRKDIIEMSELLDIMCEFEIKMLILNTLNIFILEDE